MTHSEFKPSPVGRSDEQVKATFQSLQEKITPELYQRVLNTMTLPADDPEKAAVLTALQEELGEDGYAQLIADTTQVQAYRQAQNRTQTSGH